MTKITVDRAVLEDALKALRGYRLEMGDPHPCDAEQALEAALAQQEKAEPVAWTRKVRNHWQSRILQMNANNRKYVINEMTLLNFDEPFLDIIQESELETKPSRNLVKHNAYAHHNKRNYDKIRNPKHNWDD